jgi:hypothetical protein
MSCRKLRLLSALGAVTGLVVLATPVVLAGSSGQQIRIYAGTSTQSVKIAGDNQIGEEIHQTLNTPSSPTSDTGYWWEGEVSITSYSGTNGSGSNRGTVYCDVPVSQSGNWYDCSAD